MPIYAEFEKRTYTNAPEGLWPAVLVDVEDLGIRRNTFNNKDQHKVRLIWQLEEVNEETGYRFTVSQMYTLTMNPKGKLSETLEAWRGKPFTDKEREKFDLETLIGQPCQVQVTHRAGNEGSVFANVTAVVKLGKGMVAPRAENYTRKKDRVQNTTVGEALSGDEPKADGVPF